MLAVYDIRQKARLLGPVVVNPFSFGTAKTLFWWPDRALLLYEERSKSSGKSSLEYGIAALHSHRNKVDYGGLVARKENGARRRGQEKREKQRQREGRGRRIKKEDLGTHTFLESLSCISFSHPAAPSHWLIYMLQFIPP